MVQPIDILDLSGRRRTPYIPQSEASECALACLAMVAATHGLRTDLGSLRQRYEISLKGASLTQVMQIAHDMGFHARPLRGDLDDLQHLVLPAILHWNMNHFVVLVRVTSSNCLIHDPAKGILRLKTADLSRSWTGVALECHKADVFRPRADVRQLRISQLWASMDGLGGTLARIFALSAVLQLIALAGPYYMQTAIDTVLPSADMSLLNILAIGFAGLALLSFFTSWLRSLILVTVNNSLTYQIIVNLFRHMVRLPLAWFEKRHMGDVVSRFSSTQSISQLLSSGLISVFVDGLMALATLGLMATYSLKLTLLSAAALLLYIGLRFAFLNVLKLRNVDAITKRAAENSFFMETVRGIAAIKAFGQESNRQRLWQQSKADAVNADIKLGRLSAAFDSGNQLIVGLENVLFVWLAIGMALKAELTIGMVFAFQAYRRQFMDAAMRLVELAINSSLISVHLTRLSDIALSTPEDLAQRSSGTHFYGPTSTPSIELCNVHFRYGLGEQDVLKGVNLCVQPGESILLLGPSGGGKTTLLKIMMGLIRPTHGEVLVNGIPLDAFGLARWRAMIGSVAQDDLLYAGSIAENISFFDPDAQLCRIQAAARLAKIDEDIQHMPMQYETLVGDMGSVLSGGQRQRVLLARALYRQPAVLFSDEGTAHLDPTTETQIAAKLSELKMTYCAVAHRPGALAGNVRKLIVVQGRIASCDEPGASSDVTPAGNERGQRP